MLKKYFKTAEQWEKWLVENHAKVSELKMIFYKKHTGKPCITYEDAVKTALCYGWIDSLVNRLDEECYTRKFSKRKPNSVWSESNKKRVSQLMKAGKMQPAGIRLVDIAKQNGNWYKLITPPSINPEISEEFKIELKKHEKADSFFNNLTRSRKKEFIIWINSAKREITRTQRINESINLLLNHKHLGLK